LESVDRLLLVIESDGALRQASIHPKDQLEWHTNTNLNIGQSMSYQQEWHHPRGQHNT
jgi:hypothetical protein